MGINRTSSRGLFTLVKSLNWNEFVIETDHLFCVLYKFRRLISCFSIFDSNASWLTNERDHNNLMRTENMLAMINLYQRIETDTIITCS